MVPQKKKTDINKIQDLQKLFRRTDGDGVDDGDGGAAELDFTDGVDDELDLASVGAAETIPCRSGRLCRTLDRYSPSKLGGLAADWNMDLVYSFIANPTTTGSRRITRSFNI